MIILDIIGTLNTQIVTNKSGEHISGGEPLPGWTEPEPETSP